jgi:hypothetical protein
MPPWDRVLQLLTAVVTVTTLSYAWRKLRTSKRDDPSACPCGHPCPPRLLQECDCEASLCYTCDQCDLVWKSPRTR